MKDGVNKSIQIVGVFLICVALGYLYNDSILDSRNRFEQERLNMLSMGLGFILSSLLLFLSYFLKIDRKWMYVNQFILSYILAFIFIKNSLFFFKGFNYKFSFGSLEAKIGDLQNYELYNIAISQSPDYKLFIAWAMVLFAFLLCFRKTRALGTIGTLAICLNIYVISNGFGFQNLDRATLLLGISSFLLISQWQFFNRAFISNKRPLKKSFPFSTSKKVYESMAMIKVICFIGTIVYFHFKLEDTWWGKRDYKSNPIVGVWKIEEYAFEKEQNQTKEFFQAEALYFDQGYNAFIKHDDSLSRFKYLLDTKADQFDMYDFHALRQIDIKGKFELIHSDTLLFNGKNNKDSISLKLIRDDRFNRYMEN